jgi:hypothetical protein
VEFGIGDAFCTPLIGTGFLIESAERLRWWLHVGPPCALMLACSLFVVRGFTIQNGTLLVHRLCWNTEIPLADLQSAEVIPDACRGSLRIFGNGGGFSNTGRYWNKGLGHYRAFVNDWKSPVVLRWPHKTIVLSCEEPEAFVSAVTPP